MKAQHILLGVLYTHGGLACTQAAFQLTDIAFWTGIAPGPDVYEAALVVDWNDGQSPLAWGYRWVGSLPKTGRDLLVEVTAADPRLRVEGLATGFVSHFRLDLDLDGEAERFRPDWDGVSQFWNYYVNNEVFVDPDNFANNGHIVPPATEVVPLGDPFAATDPGAWIASSTGVLDRPLADGSWDGFIYADSDTPIAEPVAISPIPEISSFAALLLAAFVLGLHRRRPTHTS